jgi:hypothetical protein
VYLGQQVEDIAKKLEQAEAQLSGAGARLGVPYYSGSEERRRERSALLKVTHDGCKTAHEVLQGLLAQQVKAAVFGGNRGADARGGAPA